MRYSLYFVGLCCGLVGFGLGYHEGKGAATNRAAPSVAVDCFDQNGKPVQDFAAQFGGVTTACAPGQIAKPRASNPPSH